MVRDKIKYNEYMREYTRKNKERVLAQHNERHKNKMEELLKGKRCSVCDGILKLHFHHIDPTTKLYDIDHCPLKALEEELKKCVILCRHCHRGLHNKDRIIENPSYDTLRMRRWRENHQQN